MFQDNFLRKMDTFVVYHIKIKIRASVCTADGSTYVNFNSENVPWVNLHRYNKAYLYPKLNG